MNRPSKQSKELLSAIAEDSRRQAIDAAKKRAVAQQADYDTFKKLVSVAHLKPLHAAPCSTKGFLLPSWKLDLSPVEPAASASTVVAEGRKQQEQAPLSSTISDSSKSSSSSSSNSSEYGRDELCRIATTASRKTGASSQQLLQQQQLPRNSMEFAREWRRNCTTAEAKYRLLKLCGAEGLSSIFKVEVTGDLLGQLLLVLQQEWASKAVKGKHRDESRPTVQEARQADEVHAAVEAAMQQEAKLVIQLLHSLTGAGRFDLNARLIGRKAKQVAAQLCDDLAAAIAGQQKQQHAGTEADATPALQCSRGGGDVPLGSTGQVSGVGPAAKGSCDSSISSTACQPIPEPEQNASAALAESTAAAAAARAAHAGCRDVDEMLQKLDDVVLSDNVGCRSHHQQQQQQQQALLQLQHVRCKLCI